MSINAYLCEQNIILRSDLTLRKETTMTPSINAIGFTLGEKQSEMVNTKLKRIAYAEDLIVDLLLKIKHDKEFSFEATINFKWGASAHVEAKDDDFAPGLNKLMDVLDLKVKKEKDKVQEKK